MSIACGLAFAFLNVFDFFTLFGRDLATADVFLSSIHCGGSARAVASCVS
jgi:hypothetical protein